MPIEVREVLIHALGVPFEFLIEVRYVEIEALEVLIEERDVPN